MPVCIEKSGDLVRCFKCQENDRESLQSNEICGTFGVEPVCNLYKIASGLCVFFLALCLCWYFCGVNCTECNQVSMLMGFEFF